LFIYGAELNNLTVYTVKSTSLKCSSVQGHPRSLILVSIKSVYASATSCYSVIEPWSHLAPFQRYCRFSADDSTLIPPEFRGCSLWTRSPQLGSARAKTLI